MSGYGKSLYNGKNKGCSIIGNNKTNALRWRPVDRPFAIGFKQAPDVVTNTVFMF